jgi:hypothetical protein
MVKRLPCVTSKREGTGRNSARAKRGEKGTVGQKVHGNVWEGGDLSSPYDFNSVAILAREMGRSDSLHKSLVPWTNAAVFSTFFCYGLLLSKRESFLTG